MSKVFRQINKKPFFSSSSKKIIIPRVSKDIGLFEESPITPQISKEVEIIDEAPIALDNVEMVQILPIESVIEKPKKPKKQKAIINSNLDE